MELIDLYGEHLNSVFDALQRAFANCKVEFYLIGALARDAWYPKDHRTRITRDLDFAVLISHPEDYQVIMSYLIAEEKFTEVSTSNYVLLSPERIEVDLMPFGDIANGNSKIVNLKGFSSLNVTGFEEVYKAGVSVKELPSGHQFKVATLPSIVLLKLLAYQDRPEERPKDPHDISQIIRSYFDLQPDVVYGYTDLFSNDKYLALEMEELSAIAIGREINTLIAQNSELTANVNKLLRGYIAERTESIFVKHMAREAAITLEKAYARLLWLSHGIER